MNNVRELAKTLGSLLLQKQWYCVTAESCTGGLVSAAITDISGSSQWFDRAYVTYSNQAKRDLLGISPDLIATEGAVSEPVVVAMATGALERSGVDLAVAISGIAGPGGGQPEKPVGLVWIAWAVRNRIVTTQSYYFEGDRAAVRMQAVGAALEGLIHCCYEGFEKREDSNVR